MRSAGFAVFLIALASGLVPGESLGAELEAGSRDNNLNPSKGIFQESAYLFYPTLGDGFTFSRLSLDLRGYVNIFKSHVLALRMMGVLAVAEYRWNFWWRLGVTGFLGVGQARNSLLDYTLAGMHPAGGLGLRFLLLKDEMINLRVDLAYSDFRRLETYVSVGESF